MDFVVGPEIQNHAVRLINEGDKIVVLITPYFQPWEHLRFAIENARARGVDVLLVLRGGDKLRENEATAAYYKQRGVKVAFLERLHAKLYMSEKAALLTSMNLVEASATGSWEIACSATKEKDTEAYQKLAKCWVEIAEQVKLAEKRASLAPPMQVARASAARPPAPLARKATNGGHCIRCGDDIALNPDRPLCKECYAAWAKYENEDYEEKYCHSCGKKTTTTLAKPQCRPCYAAS